MRDTLKDLKPSLHCDESYNIKFCANLCPVRYDASTFLMHAECKTV